MGCWKLVVEYDGTNYSGWQEQKNARTVAGEIKRAASRALNEEVDLDAAGRTDAGVHALAQVARMKSKRSFDAEKLALSVNRELPKDIHILHASDVSPKFHPRHDADLRSYLYQISFRRTAFAKRYVWWIQEELDVEKMRQAAQHFVGRHDFERFADKRSAENSTIVVLESIEFRKEGALLLIRICASHFLWKMVRRMIGCLVQVGLHQIDEQHLQSLLNPEPLPRKMRAFSVAAHTAPASGLFLEWIRYKKDEKMPLLKSAVPVSFYEP